MKGVVYGIAVAAALLSAPAFGAAGDTLTRAPLTLSVEAPLTDRTIIVGGGVFYDGGRWSEEFLFGGAFGLGAFNDLHYYFREAKMRPFVSLYGGGEYALEMDGGGPPAESPWGVGVTGGVRVNYDDRGSYVCAGAGVGHRKRGYPHVPPSGAAFIFKARCTYFFHKYLGFTVSSQSWNAEVVVTAGIAFAI